MNAIPDDAADASDAPQEGAPPLPTPDVEDFEERGTDAQVTALYAALAEAKGQFGPIVKDREVEVRMKAGGDYSFTYADMSSLLAATTPALSACGLSVLSPFTRTRSFVMTHRLILAHKEGGRLVFTFKFEPPGGGADLKTLGGHQTYLMRYAYRSVLALPGGEDLDEVPVAQRGNGKGEATVEARPAGRPAAAAQQPGPNNTQRIERPAQPVPATPRQLSRAEATRLNELKEAMKNAGYVKKMQASERMAKVLGDAMPAGDWTTGLALSEQLHDMVMASLITERAEQLKALQGGEQS